MASDLKIIGVDESGKGDFFGPLVVAAFLAPDSCLNDLREMGVRDGKTLSDKRIIEIDERLRAIYIHAVEVVAPTQYNAEYDRIRNLNKLLAAKHALVVDRILLEHDADRAVIDRFGKTELVERALAVRGRDIDLDQRFRGEAVLQVAAASILARAAFIHAMSALSDQYGLNLPKGAAPQVDRAGREFVRLHGSEVLPAVAKLHFKNYHRVVNPSLFA